MIVVGLLYGLWRFGRLQGSSCSRVSW